MVKTTKEEWRVAEITAQIEVTQAIMADDSPSKALTEWYRASGWADVENGTITCTYNELEPDLADYQKSVRDTLVHAAGFLAHRMLQDVFNIIYTEAALQAMEERGDDD